MIKKDKEAIQKIQKRYIKTKKIKRSIKPKKNFNKKKKIKDLKKKGTIEEKKKSSKGILNRKNKSPLSPTSKLKKKRIRKK